jgi:hypothetical protein
MPETVTGNGPEPPFDVTVSVNTSLRPEHVPGSVAAVERLATKVGAPVPVAAATMGPELLNAT